MPAITINRPRDEVERLWESSEYRPEHILSTGATVTFKDAPGDRGTEIRVDVDESARGGRLGEIAQKLVGTEPVAKVKDDLRRFKQLVETGEVSRSDGMPQGEALEGKPAERPAQPLEQDELQEAGV
jgi:hypothetical protein